MALLRHAVSGVGAVGWLFHFHASGRLQAIADLRMTLLLNALSEAMLGGRRSLAAPSAGQVAAPPPDAPHPVPPHPLLYAMWAASDLELLDLVYRELSNGSL